MLRKQCSHIINYTQGSDLVDEGQNDFRTLRISAVRVHSGFKFQQCIIRKTLRMLDWEVFFFLFPLFTLGKVFKLFFLSVQLQEVQFTALLKDSEHWNQNIYQIRITH